MSKTKRTLRSDTLKCALRNYFVIPVVKQYNIIAIRCLWDCEQEDRLKAELNIWAKRKELYEVLNKLDHIVAYFSCLTALTAKKTRQRKRKLVEKQLESDDSYEDFDDDDRIIPGKLKMEFYELCLHFIVYVC